MFNLPSLRIGTFFGIPVELNPTWFIILVLVAASLAFGTFPSTPEFAGWGTIGYLAARHMYQVCGQPCRNTIAGPWPPLT